MGNSQRFLIVLSRMVLLFIGFFLMSTGIVLLVKAGLGVTPWDVFHLGLANVLPLTFGQVMIIVGLFLVAISWFLEVKPNIGTILNMIFIGVFVDLILSWDLINNAPNLWWQTGYLAFGIVITGLATGLYISVQLGAGPRDALMLAINKRTGLRIRRVRTYMEIFVVTMGFSLGGAVGVGTLIFSVTIGYFTELFLRIFSSIGDIIKAKITGLEAVEDKG